MCTYVYFILQDRIKKKKKCALELIWPQKTNEE